MRQVLLYCAFDRNVYRVNHIFEVLGLSFIECYEMTGDIEEFIKKDRSSK